MKSKREEALNTLNEVLEMMSKASITLSKSFEETQNLPIDSFTSIDDIEWEILKDIESLISRFARLSDIYIQKFLRLLDELELLENGSIIDMINRAEKRKLIENAQDFITIRELRNIIAHEYVPQALIDISREVLSLTPTLITACNKALEYGKKF